MSDDELSEIRKQKREQLESKMRGDGGTTAGETGQAPSETIHVNGMNELNETVSTYDVVLVDFYADWCGPCKMLEPTVEQLAENTDAAVAKVDIDQNQELAAQYQVRGVPTLILFAGGDPAEQIVGVRGYDDLKGLIDSQLA
ncbi:thioredoxin [Haloferax mediterranei ATCC 33500]|uniref:Thioredoxin n=1 Tax=Haloferax mediterranei (strain ATCC 33500 / DSM 1411 / JCM 8866 / NBRC 14739 / NCIMB 2177 / R-4) TaxID=523841 RepID=I3R370_HALMT|nr:thioredoxin [Haloferax mediterranei]AFK18680.1 thioredoxin [Haloferax mediterranei ATCC 33500]AHZ21949.1 thioredoxin [Haloferax mediterranei ATCC 33500]EMA03459.1 thioredoxin [Haloferax mediterranei ATCC 33500]MDX5988777.1 thioredoxin [Haloferax mediterranei ATCC 33500]QCQ75180.1 thioredoxin [Haloferax mediterranei ATCC 33500]